MHYRAFISHSHSDAKFAAWLQRAIETWRVPTRLRSELGYSRIKPVFRDRTDLRAASSLGDALEDALTNSTALIVVCSNEAADSDWVDQEIARFRQFNPDAPILPIIASGEPPHCFPESLLIDAAGNALEPLAADARKGFDGKRDALLKTIAGLIDVDFDVLKQRDFRRRQQKMGAVAALSTAIAAVTLYLAYFAYEARDDANRRREQADDLIAFMLGDLRDKLEPVGKLDILSAVGDEAVDYFSQLEASEFTPELQLQYAKAFRQIGDVQFSLGKPDEAIGTFMKSRALLERQQSSGDDFERVYELAQTEFWIGYVLYENAEPERAETYFLGYRDRARQLQQLDSESLVALEELNFALTNLAALYFQLENIDAARTVLLEARRNIDQINSVGDSPEKLLAAESHFLSWMGKLSYFDGQIEEALDYYKMEARAIQELQQLRDHRFDDETLALCLERIGYMNLYLGDLDESISAFDTAMQISAKLLDHDNTNNWWRDMYLSIASGLIDVRGGSGDTPGAFDVYTAAAQKIEGLVSANEVADDSFMQQQEPGFAEASFLLSRSRLMARTGNVETALSLLTEFFDFAPLDRLDEVALQWRTAAARASLLRGELVLAGGEVEAAQQIWAHGLDYSRVGENADSDVLIIGTRKQLLARLGRVEEGEDLARRLSAAGVDLTTLHSVLEI